MALFLDPNLNHSERQFIQDQIVAHSDMRSSPRNFKNCTFVLRNEANAIVAGVIGYIVWDWLMIDLLWVSEELRGQGYGSQLLAAIEQSAMTQGCTNSRLDTFDFEAKDFYIKCGYQVYGELAGFPRGHTQFHMQKSLYELRA